MFFRISAVSLRKSNSSQPLF